MEVVPIDADIAQGMVIGRRKFRWQSPVLSAGAGASPPQGHQPEDSIHDPPMTHCQTPSSVSAGCPVASYAARFQEPT